MRPEALVPLINIDPQVKRLVMWEENRNLMEDFYTAELERLKQEGFYLIYLCAPLRGTYQKTPELHILEAFEAAARIIGSKIEEKNTSLWIPHLHALTIFNEIKFPEARHAAISFNHYLLKIGVFDALVIVGKQISKEMKDEILTARRMGIKIISNKEFLKIAQDSPTDDEAWKYWWSLTTLFRSRVRY